MLAHPYPIIVACPGHVIAKGAFILLSLALGIPGSPVFVSQWWLAFTAFVGANLLQFGFTNFCPLGLILRKLGVRDDAGSGGSCCR